MTKPIGEVRMTFWEFDQNNSGGSFYIDDERGIGPHVWVEAANRDDAIARALSLGIYFDGVEEERDCECCGDRWYKPYGDEGKESVEIDPKYDFYWHSIVYVHHLNGTIERIIAPQQAKRRS